MTDTDRLNWIESNAATVHSFLDERGRITGWAVHHSLFGWFHSEVSVRHAVDSAARGVFAEDPSQDGPGVVNAGRQ